MFFAVEGGGFFSSSTSGYSQGISLLLLGQNSDEKHMRVASLNQYQLADQETESDLQLASGKHQLSRGCASVVCFGRASAGLNEQLPRKVNHTQAQDISTCVSGVEREELSAIVENDISARHLPLRSCMKKPLHNIPQSTVNNGELKPLTEVSSIPEELKEKRKIQWTDACGKELAEIREFEVSEHGESDDEFGSRNSKTCACVIM